MKHITRYLGLLLPALTLAPLACGEDADPLTRDEFCLRWADSACSPETVAACQAEGLESCIARQSAFCTTLVQEPFVATRAGECLDAVTRAYSDADLTAEELGTVLRLNGACSGLTSGPVARGEVCTLDAECDSPSGDQCVIKSGQEAGTCQLAVQVDPGLDCSSADAVCTAGFYCNGSNCVGAKPEGEACASSAECEEAAYCSAGACVAGNPTSASCNDDVECASGFCHLPPYGSGVCVDLLRLSLTDPLCEELR